MIVSAEQARAHALMVLNSMCSLWRDRSGGASVLRWRWTIEDSKILSADGRLPADVCNRQVTTCTYTPVSASLVPRRQVAQVQVSPMQSASQAWWPGQLAASHADHDVIQGAKFAGRSTVPDACLDSRSPEECENAPT